MRKKYIILFIVVIVITLFVGALAYTYYLSQFTHHTLNSYKIRLNKNDIVKYEDYTTYYTLTVKKDEKQSVLNCILDINSKPYAVSWGKNSIDNSFSTSLFDKEIYYTITSNNQAKTITFFEQDTYTSELDASKYLDSNIKLDMYPYIKPQDKPMRVYSTGKHFELQLALLGFDYSSCSISLPTDTNINKDDVKKLFESYISSLKNAKKTNNKPSDSLKIKEKKEEKFNILQNNVDNQYPI